MNFSFQDKSGKTVFSNTSLLEEKKVRRESKIKWLHSGCAHYQILNFKIEEERNKIIFRGIFLTA